MKCQLPSSDLSSSSCAGRHPSQIPSGISGSSSSAYSHFWPPSLPGTLPASGTIFVRSSKRSLFFPELCSFRRVFCFPCFCKIWRQTFERWGFWFRRFLGALFGNSSHRASFCELRLRPRVIFENFLSFFKAQPVLLARHGW